MLNTENIKKPETDLIIILIPVFNDWDSLDILSKSIDKVFNHERLKCEILVVDDASTIAAHHDFMSETLNNIKKVNCLKLKRNVGHQRAITIGLAYIEANICCQAVVVMDGDGEDDPKDILKLIYKCKEEKYEKIIFARRTQRSESMLFRFFYQMYKYTFKLLTDQYIDMGNFSIIPFLTLSRVVIVSEIWNHYAAGILKARIPFTSIPCKRSYRIVGKSKMNFVSLVMHGLSAISIYGDIIGTKALILSIILMLFSVLIIAVVYIVRVAVPGWAPYIAGLSFIIFLQLATISFSFIFLTLNGKNNFVFLPKRDFHYFVLDVKEIYAIS
ncbi:glycosyltransferase [Rivularia sp. UHCC 0363]|uniref:glycosyltransferase n=1 Tax=Rivularia sp. UHCC 0363 TaxID=3110244 RepID=UPI002B20F03C|nr:glycosyltransferase [Rivularia sp. UHCC 0363]MEA5597534.1 glycosyltransferase [Rivularia sp. UHCC 0363]